MFSDFVPANATTSASVVVDFSSLRYSKLSASADEYEDYRLATHVLLSLFSQFEKLHIDSYFVIEAAADSTKVQEKLSRDRKRLDTIKTLFDSNFTSECPIPIVSAGEQLKFLAEHFKNDFKRVHILTAVGEADELAASTYFKTF